MKITAFRCDNCGAVYDGNSMSGVKIVYPDLFSDKIQYKYEGNADHADCHFCMICHDRYVEVPASTIKRNNGQDEYTAGFESLSKNFYELVYRKYETNRRNQIAKGEAAMAYRKRNRR